MRDILGVFRPIGRAQHHNLKCRLCGSAAAVIGSAAPALSTSGVPRNFARRGGSNSVEDRGQRARGCGGGSPLVRDSGGSCNLIQEISFHIVKFS